MEKNLEKIVPIYDAVISLIAEGMSLPEIKVSDISKRAGIGKGTIYEYFYTKEQVIAQAILYSVSIELEALSDTLSSKESFREKYSAILNWLDSENIPETVLISLFKLTHDSGEMTPALKQEVLRQIDKWDLTDQLIHSPISALRKEADVSEETEDFKLYLAISSQLGSYIMSTRCNSPLIKRCNCSFKELTYENIIKMVS